MLSVLARHWWLVALRGLVAILFGVAAFVWPILTLVTMVFLFAFYALADGIFGLITAIQNRKTNERWWVLLLEGLVSLLAGGLALAWPGPTALVIAYLIAAWAIFSGVLEIMAAIQLRREITGEWLLALGGILSILFGVFIIVAPGAGVLSLIWLIGTYAIFFGVLLLVLGFRLRSWGKSLETSIKPAT